MTNTPWKANICSQCWPSASNCQKLSDWVIVSEAASWPTLPTTSVAEKMQKQNEELWNQLNRKIQCSTWMSEVDVWLDIGTGDYIPIEGRAIGLKCIMCVMLYGLWPLYRLIISALESRGPELYLYKITAHGKAWIKHHADSWVFLQSITEHGHSIIHVTGWVSQRNNTAQESMMVLPSISLPGGSRPWSAVLRGRCVTQHYTGLLTSVGLDMRVVGVW